MLALAILYLVFCAACGAWLGYAVYKATRETDV